MLRIAFVVAVALHLLFYLAIDIKKSVPGGAAPMRTITCVAVNEEERPTRISVLKLPHALVQETVAPLPPPPIQTPLLKEEAPLADWLNALSHDDYKARPRFYPEVECRLLGALAGQALPQEKAVAWGAGAERHMGLYEICIEGSSGRVVFWRLIDGEGAKLAEEYLQKLRVPVSTKPLIKGQAEIIVTESLSHVL